MELCPLPWVGYTHGGGAVMKIKDFIEPELDLYRKQCNFVGIESELFEMRSKGIPLEEIAELTGFTYDGIKKISKDVNEKIIRVRQYFGTF